jgi:hypothetical protein
VAVARRALPHELLAFVDLKARQLKMLDHLPGEHPAADEARKRERLAADGAWILAQAFEDAAAAERFAEGLAELCRISRLATREMLPWIKPIFDEVQQLVARCGGPDEPTTGQPEPAPPATTRDASGRIVRST